MHCECSACLCLCGRGCYTEGVLQGGVLHGGVLHEGGATRRGATRRGATRRGCYTEGVLHGGGATRRKLLASLEHIVCVLQDGHEGLHDSKFGYKLILTPIS